MKFDFQDIEEFMIPQKEVTGQVAKVLILSKLVGCLARF